MIINKIVRRTLGEEFEVVGAVEDGKEAVNAILTLNPDALVIDISMPILTIRSKPGKRELHAASSPTT